MPSPQGPGTGTPLVVAVPIARPFAASARTQDTGGRSAAAGPTGRVEQVRAVVERYAVAGLQVVTSEEDAWPVGRAVRREPTRPGARNLGAAGSAGSAA
jgi:hypothetical protein